MGFIEDIHNIINPEFIWDKAYLVEEMVDMQIDVDKKGCKSLIFQFDKKLSKSDFKGGLFPFFNHSLKNITVRCDYIIFAEKAGSYYALIIELKSSNHSMSEQLKAGAILANFIKETANRVSRKDYKIETRKIAIRNNKINKKRKTRISEISYYDNYSELTQSKLVLQACLK